MLCLKLLQLLTMNHIDALEFVTFFFIISVQRPMYEALASIDDEWFAEVDYEP